MKNTFYTVISRDNFINLYRHGNLKVVKNFVFNNDEVVRENIVEALRDMHCEHDEDYVILEFLHDQNSHRYDSILFDMKIQKIKNIFVLSEKALGYYKPKFNPKIQFRIDPFKVLNEVNEHNELDDMEKGVDVFIEQFDFIDKDIIEKELGSNFLKKFLKEENILFLTFESFYLDLIFYDRKNFFPSKDVGFIYDLIVLAILAGRDEQNLKFYSQGQLSLNKISTYKTLKDKDVSLNELIKFLLNSEDEKIQNFVSKKIGKKQLVVGVLFLKLKQILLDKNLNYYENIKETVDTFFPDHKDEVAISLYLIGLSFGYKELYNDYYDFLNLNIFCPPNINTLQESTTDELKNEISELKKELEKYKKEKSQSTQKIATESFTQDDLEIKSIEVNEKENNVYKDDNRLGQKLENIEDMNTEEQLEGQINSMSTPIEDNKIPDNSLSDEKVESIKYFLNYLDQDALIDIWSSAGGINKKDLASLAKEDIVNSIIKHESSCLTVKELLQTFHRDTLASVVYKLYQKSKTKGRLKDLKDLDKEILISKLLNQYTSRVIKE